MFGVDRGEGGEGAHQGVAGQGQRQDLHDRHAAAVPVHEEAGGVHFVQVHAGALQELRGERDLLDDETRRGRLKRSAVRATRHREDVAPRHLFHQHAQVRRRCDEPLWLHEVGVPEAAARAHSGVSVSHVHACMPQQQQDVWAQKPDMYSALAKSNQPST